MRNVLVKTRVPSNIDSFDDDLEIVNKKKNNNLLNSRVM